MVRVLIITLLVVLTWPSSWVQAQTDSTWNVGANWLLLKRGDPHDAPIITGATPFNASQFDFDYENGFEIFGSHQIAPNWTAQLRYLQVDGFDASESLTISGPNGIFDSEPSGGAATFTYFTRLYSAEANLITASQFPWLDLIGGIRYVGLDDDSFTTNPANTGFYVENDLLGFQLGGDATLLTTDVCRINLNAIGKAGIYWVGSQSNFVQGTESVSDKADDAALVAEIAIIAKYPLTSRLSFETSYHLLWLEGVAVAGDQYTTSYVVGPNSTVLNHGGVFFQGFDFGLVADW